MAGAAVTDFLDEYAASDLNVWWRYGLGGSPWRNDNLGSYRRQSPITYAHRIRTPTLILADVGDERAPITQSYELYHTLKDNGVGVKFVAYPVAGHFPPDPVHRLDVVFRRWIAWAAGHSAARRETAPPSSRRRR